jgi:hypothetical protein
MVKMTSQKEKDRQSKSRLFIKYLNAPVRDDPTSIVSIFNEIDEYLDKQQELITGAGGYDGSGDWQPNFQFPPMLFSLPSELPTILGRFTEYADLDIAAARKRLSHFSPNDFAFHEEAIAFNAARNFRSVHKWFSNLMADLAGGADPKESIGLSYLADVVNQSPPVRYLNSYTYEWFEIFNPSFLFYDSSSADTTRWLNGLLLSFIAYDFFDYGNETDLKNFKQCCHCNQFFDAKNKQAIYCYSKACQNAKLALKKRRQREKDPVKYS